MTPTQKVLAYGGVRALALLLVGFALGRILPKHAWSWVIVLAVLAAIIAYWTWILPKPRPCLFCDAKDTVPVPREANSGVMSVAWWATPDRRNYRWVCVDHIDGYLRLLHQPQDPPTGER